jgi:hypothetical protein
MVKVSDYVIGAILFCIIVIGLTTFLYSSGSSPLYNVNFNSEYSDIYNDINNSLDSLSGVSLNASEKIEQTEGVQITQETGFVSLTAAAIDALKLPYTAYKIIVTTATSVTKVFGIPGWLTGALLAIVISVLAFLILGAILRSENI